jgi:hypothetical protein
MNEKACGFKLIMVIDEEKSYETQTYFLEWKSLCRMANFLTKLLLE